MDLPSSRKGSAVATYPEHEKLHAVQKQSQACGEFIEWLQQQGYTICRKHQHDPYCYGESEYRICDMFKDGYYPEMRPIRHLLAEFFTIDEEKLEAEKQEMLNTLREAQRVV